MEKELILTYLTNLDKKFDNVLDKLSANSTIIYSHTQKLDTVTSELQLVKEQTLKTNGRVTKLEGTTEMLAKVASTNSGLIKVSQDNIRNLQEDRNKFGELVKDFKVTLEDIKKSHNSESTDKRRTILEIGKHSVTAVVTLLAGYLTLKIK